MACGPSRCRLFEAHESSDPATEAFHLRLASMADTISFTELSMRRRDLYCELWTALHLGAVNDYCLPSRTANFRPTRLTSVSKVRADASMPFGHREHCIDMICQGPTHTAILTTLIRQNMLEPSVYEVMGRVGLLDQSHGGSQSEHTTRRRWIV